MLFPRPPRHPVSYLVNLPPAVSDRLDSLREQYPEYTPETLLAAACTFVLNGSWRTDTRAREETMWRLGVKIISSKVDVPRVHRRDQRMPQQRKAQRWSDQADWGC